MSYYNTTHLSGDELKDRTKKSESQKDIILRFFKSNPFGKFTPFDIHSALGFNKNNTPITSVRRAMSDLGKEKEITNTGEKSIGLFGASNYKWTLNKDKYPVKYKQLSIV